MCYLYFYYNSEHNADERELASLADTEFITDFPSPEYKTDCPVVVVPFPKRIRIPLGGRRAYKRFKE